jgi:hypothetical protein
MRSLRGKICLILKFYHSVGADYFGSWNPIVPVVALDDIVPFFNCAFKSYACEAFATFERRSANARNAVGDGYVSEVCAPHKGKSANARNSVWDNAVFTSRYQSIGSFFNNTVALAVIM